MRKLLFFSLTIFISTCVIAQTKPIELSELIKTFAPDLTKPNNYTVLKSYANKKHQVNVLINGKRVIPDEILMLDNVIWVANLNKSMSQYTLQAQGFDLTATKNVVSALFPNADFSFTSLLKCSDKNDAKNWTEIFEVKIAGKKPIWIKVESSAMYGPYMPAVDIYCYSNKAELALKCNY